MKVQVHANWKSLQQHASILKFLIHIADWLSNKYKLHHTVQEKAILTRKRKFQKAKEEEERNKVLKQKNKGARLGHQMSGLANR